MLVPKEKPTDTRGTSNGVVGFSRYRLKNVASCSRNFSTGWVGFYHAKSKAASTFTRWRLWLKDTGGAARLHRTARQLPRIALRMVAGADLRPCR